MSHTSEFVLRAFLIGAGATIVMDLWARLLKQLGIPSLNFAFLGRWIGHLPEGQWIHEGIARAAPIKGELWMGWFGREAPVPVPFPDHDEGGGWPRSRCPFQTTMRVPPVPRTWGPGRLRTSIGGKKPRSSRIGPNKRPSAQEPRGAGASGEAKPARWTAFLPCPL